MVGKIISIGITGIVGLLMTILGHEIWKKENIDLLHDYHTDKVSPENREDFCAVSGIGALIIGGSLVITAVILGFTESTLSFICLAVGFVVGLSMLITAGIKYNR